MAVFYQTKSLLRSCGSRTRCCVFAAATVNYREEVLFQIGYRADLTTANMVRYNGTL